MKDLSLPINVAEVEVSYSNKIPVKDRIQIKCSTDAVNVFRKVFPTLDHIEYMYMLLLSRNNMVLGYHQVAKGGITGVTADVRIFYQIALKTNATSIMIAHNHPSGNINCSRADYDLTHKLKKCGDILDIPLLDHIILTSDEYYSMADCGEL